MEDLNQEERRVIEECGTEPRFSSDLVEEDRDGVFRCRNCGQALFSSDHKFESGSGWPSFYDVLDAENIEKKEDRSKGMKRTEVTCSNCGAHLGHVFEDGPEDETGLRYCINGIALDFKPEN
ncbi:MAG: peptide-methionine (R)-S-oxide reductase MsrB [Candidatus Nanohaloarchaea archaeon]